MVDIKQRLTLEADASSFDREADRIGRAQKKIGEMQRRSIPRSSIPRGERAGGGEAEEDLFEVYKDLNKELTRNQKLVKDIEKAREKVDLIDDYKKALAGERGEYNRVSKVIDEQNSKIVNLGEAKIDVRSEIKRLEKQLREEAKANGTTSKSYKIASKDLDDKRKKLVAVTQAEKRAKDQLKIHSGELKDASRQIKSTSNTINTQSFVLQKMQKGLSKAGVQSDRLDDEQTRLGKEIDKTTRKIEEQGKAIDVFNRKKITKKKGLFAPRSPKDLITGGAVGALAGGGILRGLLSPVRTGIEVEKKLSRVEAKALSGVEDEGERKRLKGQFKNQAFSLGRSTSFSTSQVLDGQEILAASGFDPEEILKAVPGLLTVAKAGDIGLGDASNVSTGVLRGFDLDVGEIGRVGDILSFTAVSSKTNMVELGEAFKFVSGSARELFGSTPEAVERTAAAFAVLADSNIRGSEAGTALRASLTRLAAPTKTAQGLMDDLGIETQDSEGNLLRFSTLLENISDGTKNLSKTEKIGVIKELAGMEAATAFLTLLNKVSKEGVNGLKELENQMSNTGGMAEKMAKIIGDNADGDIAKFNSALEAFGLVFSAQVLPAITSGIQFTTKLLNTASQMAEEYPNATKALSFLAIGLGVAATAGSGLALSIGFLRFGLGGLVGTLGSLGGLAKKGFGFSGMFAGLAKWMGRIKGLFSFIWGIFSKLNPLIRAATIAIGIATAAYNLFAGDGDDETSDNVATRSSEILGDNDQAEGILTKNVEARSAAAASGGKTINVKKDFQLVINPPEGANSEEIANLVMEKLKAREADAEAELEGLYND